MRQAQVLGVTLALAAPVAAQQAVPDFAECVDIEMARYERDLARHLRSPFADRFAVGDVDGIAYCAEAKIYLCDQRPDPDVCHTDLTARQDALRKTVLANLPAPGAVRGRAGEWSDELYPRAWALAQGRSAGPDCAGVPEEESGPCAARAANKRLGVALRAWHLARYLDAAPDAITADWASPPPPTRPRAREDRP